MPWGLARTNFSQLAIAGELPARGQQDFEHLHALFHETEPWPRKMLDRVVVAVEHRNIAELAFAPTPRARSRSLLNTWTDQGSPPGRCGIKCRCGGRAVSAVASRNWRQSGVKLRAIGLPSSFGNRHCTCMKGACRRMKKTPLGDGGRFCQIARFLSMSTDVCLGLPFRWLCSRRQLVGPWRARNLEIQCSVRQRSLLFC